MSDRDPPQLPHLSLSSHQQHKKVSSLSSLSAVAAADLEKGITNSTNSKRKSNSTNEPLSLPNLVKVHQMVMKFKNKIQQSGHKLTTIEITNARIHFELMKFADYEDSVYYKVLGRDMYRLRVFPTMESSISFCENLIPGSRLISFDDLLNASRQEETKDVMIAYLRRLAANGDTSIVSLSKSKIETLPNIQSPKISQKTNQLFTQKLFGTQARLKFNSRQKQTIVPQDSDHTNVSIRARPKVPLRRTEFTLPNDSEKEDISISYRSSRPDSGFSYREAGGGRLKSTEIRIITHESFESFDSH